jgi:hypothetical protein
MGKKEKVNRKRKVYSLTLSDTLIRMSDDLYAMGEYDTRSAFLEDAGKRRYKTIMRGAK